jgi:hypothetical protein
VSRFASLPAFFQRPDFCLDARGQKLHVRGPDRSPRAPGAAE